MNKNLMCVYIYVYTYMEEIRNLSEYIYVTDKELYIIIFCLY